MNFARGLGAFLFLRHRMKEDASSHLANEILNQLIIVETLPPRPQRLHKGPKRGSRKERGPDCTAGVLGQSSTSEPIFLGLWLRNGVWHCREAAARLEWGNLAYWIDRLLEPSPIGRNDGFCEREGNLRARPL